MSRIEEIKARLAAATPGPWSIGTTTRQKTDPRLPEFYQTPIRVGQENAGNTLAIAYHGGPGAIRSDAQSVEANASLIANSPIDLAWAVERIEEMAELLHIAGAYLGRACVNRRCFHDACDKRRRFDKALANLNGDTNEATPKA